jgi:hypothetical protein
MINCIGSDFNYGLYLNVFKNIMPRSPYSLFHRKTLKKRMGSFGFPKNLGDRLQKISKWVTYIQAGNQSNPVTDAEFLHDLCVDVLGYKSPFDSNSKIWELEFTPTTALGFFGTEANCILVEIIIGDIRIKPQVSATTEWIIVTDYRYIRLYASNRMKIFYEEFSLEEIVNNSEYLKQFYFMLCRRTLLGANSREQSRLSKLLTESDETVQEIINSFYIQYYKIREQLIKDFSYRLQLISSKDESLKLNISLEQNSTNSISLMAIAKSQKLLNRIIFINYCQDCGLLPSQLIINAYQFYNPYLNQPIWENYKAVFSWISKGNVKESVFNYGSSLFEFDLILDEMLFVGDELCRQIKELSRFDFNQDLSGMAIAIILEELTKDLDILKSPSLIRRKKLKYPHKVLQNYESIEVIIKSHLAQKLNSQLTNQKLDRENTPELNDWLLQKSNLENLKIYVPDSGSGLFLVMALNILIDEYQHIYKNLNLEGDDNLAMRILENQIYGGTTGDRCGESIEITKLNLWLNTVNLNQALVNLENNIQSENLCTFQEVITLAQTIGDLVILK